MEITKRAKERLENRIKELEDFIEEKGLGSSYVQRAKRIQRTINISIFVGSVITMAGIMVWMMSKSSK